MRCSFQYILQSGRCNVRYSILDCLLHAVLQVFYPEETLQNKVQISSETNSTLGEVDHTIVSTIYHYGLVFFEHQNIVIYGL